MFFIFIQYHMTFIIDDNISSKWFNHHDLLSTTSIKHTKDVAWKIKVATNTLPTLDILN